MKREVELCEQGGGAGLCVNRRWWCCVNREVVMCEQGGGDV